MCHARSTLHLNVPYAFKDTLAAYSALSLPTRYPRSAECSPLHPPPARARVRQVGVALSIFNTATKLVNAPLVAVTTSAVAMASGIAAATASSSQQRANTASSSAAGAAAGAVAATASGAAAAASNTTGGGGGGGGCGGGGGGAVQLAATSRNGSGALQSRGARAGAADGGGAGAAGAAGTDSSGGGLYRRLSLALSQTLAPQRSGQLAAEAENGAGAAAAKAAAAGLVDPHADSTVTEPLLAAETVSSSATSSSSNSHVANFATTTSSSGSGSGISISATAAATAAETVRVASACMLLALLLGGLQAAVLLAAGPGLLHVWGIRRGVSPVFGPALGFLMVRALGAPAATLMLAVQVRVLLLQWLCGCGSGCIVRSCPFWMRILRGTHVTHSPRTSIPIPIPITF